jgi:hypothetical protein
VFCQHSENKIESLTNNNDRQILTIVFGIEIPEQYYHCPIVGNLVSHFNLEVNILAAFLGKATERRGWFDLELRGTADRIESALVYLSVIDVIPINVKVCSN